MKAIFLKSVKRVLLIASLLISLAYVVNITSIPDSILLFKGENLELGVIYGVDFQDDKTSVQTSGNLDSNEILERKIVKLKLFNFFNVKEVEVNTIPNTKVVPLGNSVRTKDVYRRCYGSRVNRDRRKKTV